MKKPTEYFKPRNDSIIISSPLAPVARSIDQFLDYLIQSQTRKISLLNGVFSEQTPTTEIARVLRLSIDPGQFDHGEFNGVVRFD